MPYSIELDRNDTLLSDDYRTGIDSSDWQAVLIRMVTKAIGADAIGYDEYDGSAGINPADVTEPGAYCFKKPNTDGEESDGCVVYVVRR